jgi:hydrogenase/urease accessory protein HupE
MMANIIYLLCSILSMGCAILLGRAYQRNPVRLIFWTTVSFVGLAINNITLLLDIVVFPNIDFSIWRALTFFGSVAVLAFGLTWEDL